MITKILSFCNIDLRNGLTVRVSLAGSKLPKNLKVAFGHLIETIQIAYRSKGNCPWINQRISITLNVRAHDRTPSVMIESSHGE